MIKLTTIYAGPKGSKNIGEIADFGSEENAVLVNGGFAEWIEKPIAVKEVSIEPVITVIETASFKPAENAMKHKPQIKKKGGR
jgi:hypothetical protein